MWKNRASEERQRKETRRKIVEGALFDSVVRQMNVWVNTSVRNSLYASVCVSVNMSRDGHSDGCIRVNENSSGCPCLVSTQGVRSPYGPAGQWDGRIFFLSIPRARGRFDLGGWSKMAAMDPLYRVKGDHYVQRIEVYFFILLVRRICVAR